MKRYKCHFFHLREEPFKKIASGYKVFELRLYDEKRRKIKVDDIICFSNPSDENEKIIATVKSLHIFPSFEALYKVMPLELCGYEPDELAFASPGDMLAYYTKEDILRYGVVAIEIKTQEIQKNETK